MFAIVIPCYNRPDSLRRLLASLDLADFTRCTEPVTLVFSVDYSGSEDVANVAAEHAWCYGDKIIDRHPENIGLRANVLHCGDYAGEFPFVVVLEDDSIVSPGFVDYVLSSYHYYQDDSKVAQISLYSYEYDEIAYDRFHPMYEGYDGYLMQWASSRGQFWSARQWGDFKIWYQKNKDSDLGHIDIPPSVKRWPETSWKKFFIAYLVETGKFTLYPFQGYATNYGDAGQHWQQNAYPLVQVPIALQAPKEFRFADFSKIHARYDCFFQPLPESLNKLAPKLASYKYTVDLNCVREISSVTTPYILLGRDVPNAEFRMGKGLIPVELNFLVNQEAGVIALVRTDKVVSPMSRLEADALRLWNRRIILSPVSEIPHLGVRMYSHFRKRIRTSRKVKSIKSLFKISGEG